MSSAELTEAAAMIRSVTQSCRAGELEASPLFLRLADGAALALDALADAQVSALSRKSTDGTVR
jgi:hypothetical protein